MNTSTNPSFARQLAEIRAYFDHGDHHLGYRRLLDAALDTESMHVYTQTLDFCDWYDKGELANLPQKAGDLLQEIGNAGPSHIHDRSNPALKADQIRKTYAHGSFSLSTLDITVYPGQIIGLVGENGNGKTTLLRLLNGELHPDGGSISYQFSNAIPIRDQYDRRTRLAFIPQRPASWYGSLMDNLQFTAASYGYKGQENVLRTEMICARMGLRPFRKYSWKRISSGYKMRFELARTLLRKPELLLLDEPLANLDVLAQQIILEDLRYLAQSASRPMAVILSSQQLYEVEKVSQLVIFLKQGKARMQDYSTTPVADTTDTELIIELEADCSREELQTIFTGLALRQLSYNGGNFIVYFNNTRLSEVLQVMASHQLPVKYFRDITTSSRRFFDA
ncbi:MAG: ATP-binding cassette domain-containing protein [Chitinophagaceae bacterium]|jgi:ABC-2 type transport system ATP-binding protein|nr:ATP-binding cassette domain-containing protein [Chitinophagaceae bacterium]